MGPSRDWPTSKSDLNQWLKYCNISTIYRWNIVYWWISTWYIEKKYRHLDILAIYWKFHQIFTIYQQFIDFSPIFWPVKLQKISNLLLLLRKSNPNQNVHQSLRQVCPLLYVTLKIYTKTHYINIILKECFKE